MNPTAVLAFAEQQATVAAGSTEGFPTDRNSFGAATEPEGTPGATGWWIFGGPAGTTLTIDSCGSSFSAQIALYNIDQRYGQTRQVAYSADGCTNPLTAIYHEDFADSGPDLLRIDDASGLGGEYQVNYRRTEAAPQLRVRAFKAVVGQVRRPRGARRVGRATVTIPYRTDSCYCRQDVYWRLDGEPGVSVSPGEGSVTLEDVRSGRHSFELTYEAWYGGQRSVTRAFRVPYLKPKRR